MKVFQRRLGCDTPAGAAVGRHPVIILVNADISANERQPALLRTREGAKKGTVITIN